MGENFYANAYCTMLDVGKIKIGDDVLFGPHVSLYTAGHPIHPQSRKSGYEYGIPITIGDRVWIGGSCVVMPGVSIGSDTVIGAGSPCKVIQKITEEDRKYYYKDQMFDDEIWETVKNTK